MNRHNKLLPPVYPDQFDTWLKDPVTQHLFNDLEIMYIDTALDPLPTSSISKLTIESMKREGKREFIDLIKEWLPTGTNGEIEDNA